MTGLVKGLLISGVVIVLVVLIIVGAAAYWISTRGGEWIEKGKQSVAEGQAFGKETDNQGCLTEALTRHRKDASMSGAISIQVFLTACFPSSRQTPGFCDEVPRRTEFIKSGQWQVQQCQKEGLRDSYCPQIFSAVQNFCERAKGE
ncbi:MAG TPA: hypothetical protein VN643_16095 [Pyrinomonadaceae bacterium]|nr:hypothetical protein [Pyrinomonadaceae bacterium]